MRRFYFIVNPVAGSGRGSRSFLEARSILQGRGAQVEYAYSEYPGHAIQLIQEALAAGESSIVAVGGDGTVREVAGGMIGSHATLGFLPAGSGNDLTCALGISTDVMEAVDILLNGTERYLDTATANGTPFFNVGGLGFDVQVIVKTEFYKKRLNGMLPYFMGIVSSLTHLSPLRLTYRADDGPETVMDSLLTVVANGNRFGGGMMAAPLASPYDGMFDVCAIAAIKLPTFLNLLPSFIKGKHLDKKPVTYFKASEITIDSVPPARVELDGEIIESTPVAFKLQPRSLRVLVK